MKSKTKITAEDSTQEIIITREFDLPIELLFRAYTEAEFVEQWMGVNVLKMESKTHGSYEFEAEDEQGKVVFRANGVIHKIVPPHQTIIRTIEMDDSEFPAQLEFLEFSELPNGNSKLTIHIICKSISYRDKMVQQPYFAEGNDQAHNSLQEVMNNYKKK